MGSRYDETTRATVATLLATGVSYREVERAHGVSRETVRAWMADADYRATVERAQGAFREIAVARLRGLAIRAMDALDDALDDGHPDRTRAALEVLDRVGLGKGATLDVTLHPPAAVDREALAVWVASKLDASDD